MTKIRKQSNRKFTPKKQQVTHDAPTSVKKHVASELPAMSPTDEAHSPPKVRASAFRQDKSLKYADLIESPGAARIAQTHLESFTKHWQRHVQEEVGDHKARQEHREKVLCGPSYLDPNDKAHRDAGLEWNDGWLPGQMLKRTIRDLWRLRGHIRTDTRWIASLSAGPKKGEVSERAQEEAIRRKRLDENLEQWKKEHAEYVQARVELRTFSEGFWDLPARELPPDPIELLGEFEAEGDITRTELSFALLEVMKLAAQGVQHPIAAFLLDEVPEDNADLACQAWPAELRRQALYVYRHNFAPNSRDGEEEEDQKRFFIGLALSAVRQEAAAMLDGGPSHGPKDLITKAVVLRDYRISPKTLARSIRSGKIKDYRPAGHKKNEPWQLSRAEVAAIWPRH
jgi:hypothetical protein